MLALTRSRGGVKLAFKSTQSEFFERHSSFVVQSIHQGSEIHGPLHETGVFSQALVDAVQIGEETGRLAESLESHAKQLDGQVKVAFGSMAFAAGVGVWILVGMFIVFLIFRIASFYLGIINEALNGF